MGKRQFTVTLATDSPEPFISLMKQAGQYGNQEIVVNKTHIFVEVQKIAPNPQEES